MINITELDDHRPGPSPEEEQIPLDTVSWQPEVIADNSGKWVAPNAIRFATKEEAKIYVDDLERRWSLVRQTRVAPSSDPVNYRIVKGDVHFRLEVVE